MNIVYIGLLRPDGTEPAGAGYCRVPVSTPELLSLALHGQTFAFPEVMEPGYGIIASIAAYSRETGGEILHTWPLDKPLDIHGGVIPVIRNGRLLRGVEMQVEPVKVKPRAVCRAEQG